MERRRTSTSYALAWIVLWTAMMGLVVPASGSKFCVATPGADSSNVQAALDWACGTGSGQGNVDCSAVQAGGACYCGNTADCLPKVASWVFNSYFQATGMCDFPSACTLTSTNPSSATCKFASSASTAFSTAPGASTVPPSRTGTSTSTESAGGANSPPSTVTSQFCVATPGADSSNVQPALDWACGTGSGQGNVDCSAVQAGGACYCGNTADCLPKVASWVFNSYFQATRKCDFPSASTLTSTDPSTATCKFASSATTASSIGAGNSNPTSTSSGLGVGTTGGPGTFCVAAANAASASLQSSLDWVCTPAEYGGGAADCSPILPGAPCFIPWDKPTSLPAHASYAFNDYYQRNGKCDFPGGISTLSTTNPSSHSTPACLKLTLANGAPPPLADASTAPAPTTDPVVGITWGMLSDASWDLTAEEWVGVLVKNKVPLVKFYSAPAFALTALANTGIEVQAMVTLDEMSMMGGDATKGPAIAVNWVDHNVVYWRKKGVRITSVAVGNEPFASWYADKDFKNTVVPAMQMIFNALKARGLEQELHVTSPLDAGFLTWANPPSAADIKQEFLSQIKDMSDFLLTTGSYFTANVYSYDVGKSGNMPFALFDPAATAVVDGAYSYKDFISLMIDGMYVALEKHGYKDLEIRIGETNWPDAGDVEATPENAHTYLSRLVPLVTSTKGTPRRPGRPIHTFLFELYDGDLKPVSNDGTTERHWGIFELTGQPKYPDLDLFGSDVGNVTLHIPNTGSGNPVSTPTPSNATTASTTSQTANSLGQGTPRPPAGIASTLVPVTDSTPQATVAVLQKAGHHQPGPDGRIPGHHSPEPRTRRLPGHHAVEANGRKPGGHNKPGATGRKIGGHKLV